MRRFVTLVILLLFSIPFGVSISGCSKKTPPVYCNGGDSGVATGQATTISLTPIVYGISLNFAQLGQVNTPSVTDCKGSSVAVQTLTYGTTDMTIADVQPGTGRLCGGTWNRNTGGGIADYTVCVPTRKSGTAYISVSGQGVTSNPLPVFVHPVVTSIVLGSPSLSCATDPTTSCCPLTTVGSPTATAYDEKSCVSQGDTRQLVARIYAGDPSNPANNISCQAGHLQFTSQSASSQGAAGQVVTIDSNGVATANQPGSVLISANLANAASSAGFFSTCPPASITLSAPGAVTVSKTDPTVVINQNNTQPLVATAIDTVGHPLTGLALEYVSTSPTTIPAGAGGSIVPPLAGAASISAICQPPNCNPSAYNQIGLFGNGKPVTSNSVDFVAPGINSTVLYMASTQSQYVVTRDFTQPSSAAPVLLPFLPNSMVITNDGATIYMGSSTGLMVLNASNSLSVTRTDISQPGTVLAVSPNGSQIVISDPAKQLITLETSSGGAISSYGAACPVSPPSFPTTPPTSLCRAQFAPDSNTVYIAAGNQLLVYSAYTGWTSISPATASNTPVTDVAITVPSVGAYFAGSTTTARSYCPITTPTTTPTVENNEFYPLADSSPATTDRIAATNDGFHILGATITPKPTLNDLQVEIPALNTKGPSTSIACPLTGALAFSNTVSPIPLSKITAGAITGVLPTSDSKLAFVTYTLPAGSTASSPYLPAYSPGSVLPIPYVTLSGTATAPIAGVLSADNTTFFAGTSGDNLVHLITITPGTPDTESDTSTLAPNLTSPLQIPITGVVPGAVVPVDLLVQKPRKTT